MDVRFLILAQDRGERGIGKKVGVRRLEVTIYSDLLCGFCLISFSFDWFGLYYIGLD